MEPYDQDKLAASMEKVIADHFRETEDEIGFSAYDILDIKETQKKATVYALVTYISYNYNGEEIKEKSKTGGSAAITFSKDADGDSATYKMLGYWAPSENNYERDIRVIFPAAVQEEVMEGNGEKLRAEACLNKAKEFFAENPDEDEEEPIIFYIEPEPEPDPEPEIKQIKDTDLGLFIKALLDETTNTTLTLVDGGKKSSYAASECFLYQAYYDKLTILSDNIIFGDKFYRIEALGCTLDYRDDIVRFVNQAGDVTYYRLYPEGQVWTTTGFEPEIIEWFDISEFCYYLNNSDRAKVSSRLFFDDFIPNFDMVIPDRGQSFLDAAKECMDIIGSAFTKVRAENQWSLKYYKAYVYEEKGITEGFRTGKNYNGEIKENAWGLSAVVVIIPENETGFDTYGEYHTDYKEYREGEHSVGPDYDPSNPEGAEYYLTDGLVEKEDDGWHCSFGAWSWY